MRTVWGFQLSIISIKCYYFFFFSTEDVMSSNSIGTEIVQNKTEMGPECNVEQGEGTDNNTNCE